jgi:oligopeptide transport system substrate-binding protein
MIALRTLAVAALALLAACSPSGNSQSVHATDHLVRGNGPEIKSLDPHYIDGQWEANVVGDALIGLTTDGPDGKPIPGAATSWETSADGKTWTFHMREHVWSDGQPVTAQDFVYAWRRILEPARGAPYAYYLWLVQNAHEISNGALPPSALGVSAPDDRTLVVHLVHPAPYMLEYLLHQAVFPVPRHVVEKLGNDWAKPRNYVANGPYIPAEWIANDHVTLVKNPKFYDADNVRIKTIIYKPSQDALAALESVRAGELDTQNILASSEIGWMRKHIPRALQINTFLGLSYITPNFRRKPFDDLRVREAIALTMNREIVTTHILRLGMPVAYSIVPPGVANYPGGAALDFKSLPYEKRILRAQRLMRDAGYGPTNRLHTTYSTIPTPDSKRSAAVLQALLRNVYIDIDIDQTDTQIFYKKLQEGHRQLRLDRRFQRCDDLPRPAALRRRQQLRQLQEREVRRPDEGRRRCCRSQDPRRISETGRTDRAGRLRDLAEPVSGHAGHRRALCEGLGPQCARLQPLALALDRRARQARARQLITSSARSHAASATRH